ncbi:hypothetical protein MP228_010225 [Amoeboaphelidium protococcarum]|nr:hypothetical protein MP228_010225 [Amoeboaphelidium protococcarum]
MTELQRDSKINLGKALLEKYKKRKSTASLNGSQNDIDGSQTSIVSATGVDQQFQVDQDQQDFLNNYQHDRLNLSADSLNEPMLTSQERLSEYQNITTQTMNALSPTRRVSEDQSGQDDLQDDVYSLEQGVGRDLIQSYDRVRNESLRSLETAYDKSEQGATERQLPIQSLQREIIVEDEDFEYSDVGHDAERYGKNFLTQSLIPTANSMNTAIRQQFMEQTDDVDAQQLGQQNSIQIQLNQALVEIEEYSNKLIEADAQNLLLQNQNAALQDRINHLTEERDDIHQKLILQNDTYTQELNVIEIEHRKTIDHLQDQLTTSQEQVKIKNQESLQLRDNINALNEQVLNLQRQLNEQMEKAVQIKPAATVEKSTITVAIQSREIGIQCSDDDTQIKLSELNSILETKTVQMQQLQDQISELSAHNDELSRQKSAQSDHSAKADNQTDAQCQTDCEDNSITVSQLQSHNDQLKKQCRKLELQLEERQSMQQLEQFAGQEDDDYKQQYIQVCQQLAQVAQQRRQLFYEVERLKSIEAEAADKYKNQCEDLTAKNLALNRVMARLTKIIWHHEDQLCDMAAQLEQVKSQDSGYGKSILN